MYTCVLSYACNLPFTITGGSFASLFSLSQSGNRQPICCLLLGECFKLKHVNLDQWCLQLMTNKTAVSIALSGFSSLHLPFCKGRALLFELRPCSYCAAAPSSVDVLIALAQVECSSMLPIQSLYGTSIHVEQLAHHIGSCSCSQWLSFSTDPPCRPRVNRVSCRPTLYLLCSFLVGCVAPQPQRGGAHRLVALCLATRQCAPLVGSTDAGERAGGGRNQDQGDGDVQGQPEVCICVCACVHAPCTVLLPIAVHSRLKQ